MNMDGEGAARATLGDLLPDDPRMVGRYRLTRRLGHGGMGTVFLGWSPGGRPVAVKVISPQYGTDPAFRKRFATEIESAKRVGGFFTAVIITAVGALMLFGALNSAPPGF